MEFDYQKILDCIPPSCTDRNQWVQVGMALKQEGQPFEMFDRWSAGDSRPNQYRGSEVTRKVWDSFKNSGSGTVTGATLTLMARDLGMDPFPASDGFMDWGDEITSDGVEPVQKTIRPPRPDKSRKDVFQIIDYLEAVFRPEDHINVITSSFVDEEGKRKPIGTGLMTITVEEYCDSLRKGADSQDFFEDTFGSYNHESGVWVRINPISGTLSEGQKGISDKNVTRFENALIECDSYTPEEQIRLIRELGLPYRALVYSGGKSVHAIVKVDGQSLTDYKEKVSWLFGYCTANGLPVDTQNKNPSRMSRLPGVDRGTQKQTLLETAKPMKFDEFRKLAQAKEDAKELEIESFADVCDNLPPLAPELIHGVLRKGHKMLISGPSKAGKSYALTSLAVAMAEGKDWMGYQVEQGKVLYINLEIDSRSFMQRIKDVYDAHGWKVEHPNDFRILNLRGKAESLDSFAPKLEARIRNRGYSLVIVDPIYKVITGDENNASDMGKFCNLFDRISLSGECAVAYCHHHSKGSQASKNAIDRASGSGVFARDPDAIIDMTRLDITDADREEIKARLAEKIYDEKLRETGQWDNLQKIHPQDLTDRMAKQELVRQHFELFPDRKREFEEKLSEAQKLGDCPAYRISMTLREFASPEDRDVFFQFPKHVADPTGVLADTFLEGDNDIAAMNKKKAEKTQKRADMKLEWYDQQREQGHQVTIQDLVDHFSSIPKAKCKSKNTARAWVDNHPELVRINGLILYADEAPEETGVKRVKNEIDPSDS